MTRYIQEVALMALVVAVIVFAGLFMIQTNRLIAALESVTVSYSSHNRINAGVVHINDGEFDVADSRSGVEVE